ncbi:MAG: signal peptidase I [Candidatus Asgardarchaeia archaeon]
MSSSSRRDMIIDVSVIMISLILVLEFPAIASYALNSEEPLTVVMSESMVPTINVGDILVVRGVPPEEVKVGDIIVFTPPWFSGESIVHRVIDKFELNGTLFFVTKGDNNPVADPPTNSSYLVGVVIAIIPKLGLITLFMKKTFFAIPLIVALLVLFGVKVISPQDSKID